MAQYNAIFQYTLGFDQEALLSANRIDVRTNTGWLIEQAGAMTASTPQVIDHIHPSPFYKKSTVHDHYTTQTFTFDSGIMVTVRVYDSGMAWHCAIEQGISLVIHDEFVEFARSDETIAIRNFTWDFENNYEKPYDRIQLAATEQRERIMLPAVFAPPLGPKVAVTESNSHPIHRFSCNTLTHIIQRNCAGYSPPFPPELKPLAINSTSGSRSHAPITSPANRAHPSVATVYRSRE